MFKLLKYDILGNYKKNLMIILAMLLADCAITFLMTKPDIYIVKHVLTILAGVATGITILIFSVKNFTSELSEDKKFLTFSLPVRGSEFLGCKVISTIMWMIPAFLVTIFFMIFIAKHDYPVELNQFVAYSIGDVFNAKAISISALMNIVGLVEFFLMVCFSASIVSIRFNNKKGSGWLGFLVFIILNVGESFARSKIVKAFADCNINMISKASEAPFSGNVMIVGSDMFKINAAGLIFDVIVIILLFVITSIVLERKVEFN